MSAPVPKSDRSAGSEINPGKTALIKIAGTLIVALAGVLLAYTLVLALALGGSDPLVFGYLRAPTTWIFLLLAAGGAGLILHARKRDALYRQNGNRRRRSA